MSFTTTLPPLVFDGPQLYVALRTDTPMIRGPVDSAGLHAIANFPGEWTYLAFEAAFKMLTEPADAATSQCDARDREACASTFLQSARQGIEIIGLKGKINAALEALK